MQTGKRPQNMQQNTVTAKRNLTNFIRYINYKGKQQQQQHKQQHQQQQLVSQPQENLISV